MRIQERAYYQVGGLSNLIYGCFSGTALVELRLQQSENGVQIKHHRRGNVRVQSELGTSKIMLLPLSLPCCNMGTEKYLTILQQ